MYEPMCWLQTYGKQNDKSNDEIIFGGGIPLPEYSILGYLVFLCVILNFINTWLKALESNFAWCCCEYQDNIKRNFKIPTEKLTPTLKDFKGKCQKLLTDIGGEWYVWFFNT